jgi:hypothetical protein
MVVNTYLYSRNFADITRLAATGHSRGGKAALCAGIYDERISVVIPNGSGCGGAGCFRFLEGKGDIHERIGGMQQMFPYWLHDRMGQFADRETYMPFDAHTLKALIAPRWLLTTDATGDLWANPTGTEVTTNEARKIFAKLGVEDHINIHFREGKHAQNEEDWDA